MASKKSPQYVISSYQKKSHGGSIVLGVIAGIIFGVGILLLVLWFRGSGSVLNIFASATPTATETFTPTPTVPTSTPTPTETETPTPTLSPTPEGPQMYTVEEGDNCWSIAVDKFGVGIDLFMSINNMTECNISAGDQVIIPGADQELPTETPFPLDQYTSGQQIEYTVQIGESYQEIASKFNSTLDSIGKLNDIEDTTSFPSMGDVLLVAVNLVTPTPTAVPTYTEVPQE